MIFDLSQLRPREQQITHDALKRCTFPWDLLLPKLKQTKQKNQIPVEWADLSRYMAEATVTSSTDHQHMHVYHSGDQAHVLTRSVPLHTQHRVMAEHGLPLAYRQRVLGLAWYSGKISIAAELVEEPTLAQEVMLAEGSHMVDFFYMTDEHRKELFKVFHSGSDAPHGHEWFDNASYWDDVGEAFMAGFCYAYSDLIPDDSSFSHRATPAIGQQIRSILTPQAFDDPFFATRRSKVFHDEHHTLSRQITFPTYKQAAASGRRPCGTCKPREVAA